MLDPLLMNKEELLRDVQVQFAHRPQRSLSLAENSGGVKHYPQQTKTNKLGAF